MNQHRLDCASVTDFLMQRSNKTHMPEKSEVVVDKATDVEHPGEVCELKGGRCAKLFGLGCALEPVACCLALLCTAARHSKQHYLHAEPVG